LEDNYQTNYLCSLEKLLTMFLFHELLIGNNYSKFAVLMHHYNKLQVFSSRMLADLNDWHYAHY